MKRNTVLRECVSDRCAGDAYCSRIVSHRYERDVPGDVVDHCGDNSEAVRRGSLLINSVLVEGQGGSGIGKGYKIP